MRYSADRQLSLCLVLLTSALITLVLMPKCCCSKEREEEDTELRPIYMTPLLSTAGADLTISRLCFDMRDASYATFFAGSADGMLACVKLATNEVRHPPGALLVSTKQHKAEKGQHVHSC